MTFSVMTSWVSLLPPTRWKFGPLVMRLLPSESNPTPNIIVEKMLNFAGLKAGGRPAWRQPPLPEHEAWCGVVDKMHLLVQPG